MSSSMRGRCRSCCPPAVSARLSPYPPCNAVDLSSGLGMRHAPQRLGQLLALPRPEPKPEIRTLFSPESPPALDLPPETRNLPLIIESQTDPALSEPPIQRHKPPLDINRGHPATLPLRAHARLKRAPRTRACAAGALPRPETALRPTRPAQERGLCPSTGASSAGRLPHRSRPAYTKCYFAITRIVYTEFSRA